MTGAALCLSVFAIGSPVQADGAHALAGPATADGSFGQPVPADDLATARGGENDITDSFNTTLTIDSQQSQSATNDHNSIDTHGGDVVAGSVTIDGNAFSDMHGMSNVVINTAPQANVQGAMSLNLILPP
jgi:hypothetical protein